MKQSVRERQDIILAEAAGKSRITAPELAEILGVSEATVRRDLHALAEQGRLELAYGGASLPRIGDFSYQSKSARNPEAKRLIGQLAMRFVQDGEQLFLDSGTTCFELARLLKQRRGLAVIVNSARLALELDSPNLDVILLGGKYRPDRMDTVGPLTSAALQQLRGYTAFVGADGLSMNFGLTAGDVESAFIFRQAVSQARQVNLLVDHSKFMTQSLCKIIDWDPITRVITDQPLSDDWADFLTEKNIDVITPETPEEDVNDTMQ